jgi:hypothetical protein
MTIDWAVLEQLGQKANGPALWEENEKAAWEIRPRR